VDCKNPQNTRTEIALVNNKDMPILTFSTDLDNVDPNVYFARNFVRLGIMKRFEIVLFNDVRLTF